MILDIGLLGFLIYYVIYYWDLGLLREPLTRKTITEAQDGELTKPMMFQLNVRRPRRAEKD